MLFIHIVNRGHLIGARFYDIKTIYIYNYSVDIYNAFIMPCHTNLKLVRWKLWKHENIAFPKLMALKVGIFSENGL